MNDDTLAWFSDTWLGVFMRDTYWAWPFMENWHFFGLFFFAGDPFRYFYNIAFQWKMALIVLAGINALWFWFGEHAKLSKLADGEQADFPAKVIATLSLAIWMGVIVLGRLIPYLE
jgi:hypothetical protein